MADLTGDVQVLNDSGKASRILLVGDASSGASDDATLVDVATLSGAAADGSDRVLIDSVKWNVGQDEVVLLQWASDSGVSSLALTGTGDWSNLNLKNIADSSDTGTTGDILLATSNSCAFSILIGVRKYAGFIDVPNPRFGPPITGDLSRP
jgi:hypothetical protein